MVELYWSESDVAWNGYLDFLVVCLYWSDLSAEATSLQNGLQPNFQATSLSPQYKCTLMGDLWPYTLKTTYDIDVYI